VTRNIFRGTTRAYSGDKIALPLALELAESIETLPFHFQATVCICLCHAEDARIQGVLRDCIDKIANQAHASKNHRGLIAALHEIQKKHEERIVLFSRFPERNAILGRKNSKQEAAYLAQLK